MTTIKPMKLVLCTSVLSLSIGAVPAAASDTFVSTFNSTYPASQSGNNASCRLCHTASNSQLNQYGRDFAEQLRSGLSEVQAMRAIENAQSDNDPASTPNITEINASAQPGWTPGPNNTFYVRSTLAVAATNQSPPATITGLLDPPSAGNGPPVANAGTSQAVQVGQTVTLDGSQSTDPDSDPLTYAWSLTRPAGSTATLSNATSVQPTFVADVAGTYTAQLIVNDGAAASPPATVTVTAAPAPNLPPVANAGPGQAVQVGQTVTLDGSQSSDPDSDPLTYAWSLAAPAGSTATLSSATSVQPTFVADVEGTYSAQLVVNDGTISSAPATVAISASAQNLPPSANAGPDQAVTVGTTVALNASQSSDPNGDPLTYAWSFVSRPAGSAAALSNATAPSPTFVVDVAGDYVVQLIVNDGAVGSTPDTVVIGADSPNQPPAANAGPAQTVAVGATVTLDGGQSNDPNGDPLTYAWSFVSRPAGSTATLSSATAQSPTFVADIAGQYVIGLVVNDGSVNSTNPATVVITASATPPVNQPPTASAGPAQTVDVGATVALDGRQSSDPDADPLTYAWSFVSMPAGSAATLSSAAAQTPTFVADIAGQYVVSLVVNDGIVNSVPGTVTVTARETPTGDVDLYIVRFTATKELKLGEKKLVKLQVAVRNVSKVDGVAPATLVGMQKGREIYRQTISASAPIGRVATLAFPSFTPRAAGKIKWTVTIEDQGSARNKATATTEVEAGRRGHSDDDEKREERESRK